MSPSVMTKYYSAFVLLLQAVCLFVSSMFVNADKPLNLIVLIFVAGLNMALVRVGTLVAAAVVFHSISINVFIDE